MQDGAYFGVRWREGKELCLGEFSNADAPLRLQDFEDGLEVGIAGVVEGFLFGSREFIGSAIFAGFFHEDQGAIVKDDMIFKEGLWTSKAVGEEAPEAASGDFRFFAGKAFDGAFRVFGVGFSDGGFDFHPVANGGDLAKRNAGLGHAPGAGIHSEEKDSFGGVCEFFKVKPMRFPGVIQWVVDVCHRSGELEAIDGFAEFVGCADEVFAYGHRHVLILDADGFADLFDACRCCEVESKGNTSCLVPDAFDNRVTVSVCDDIGST